MRRYGSLILTFVLVMTLAACGGRQADVPKTVELPQAEAAVDAAPEAAPEPEPAIPEPTPEERRVAEVLDCLTLEQKVGQLFFVRCAEPDMDKKILQYHLGGVLLFGQDFKDADGGWLSMDDFTAKIDRYRAASLYDTGIPLFIGSDEEGGTVTRATRNPNLFSAKLASPQELWKRGGMEGLLSETQKYIYRLSMLGINVNFAPVADVSTDPGDFIYDRAFGQDAAVTADYVAQVVDVMGKAAVGSVLKHFPGYGNNVDTHTGIAIDKRARETFDTSDLLPFRAGIEAGASFVLVSHNIVTCMDADFPASLSPAVHRVLREELGFDGVILTDDLAMDAVKASAASGDVATLALLAGNDMLVTTDFEKQTPQVLTAVERGILPMETIDAACMRVLTAKYRLGMLGPTHPMLP